MTKRTHFDPSHTRNSKATRKMPMARQMLAGLRHPIFAFLLISFALSVSSRAEDERKARPSPSEPIFHARDLVPTKLLIGPEYRIEDKVGLVDDRYVFLLRNPEWVIDAHGSAMLQVRLDEMKSIKKAKALDAENQEMEGAKESFKETGDGVKRLFTDPGGTLKGLPRGLGRKVKTATKGESNTKRQFAVAVGCDPETDNPVLKKLLDRLSLRRSIGKGAVAVGGFALTAGAANAAMFVRGASAMQTTAEMSELLDSTPLYKINENIRDDLIGMGIAPETAERFIEHKQMTTLQRMLFMEQFRRIRKLPGCVTLIDRAMGTLNRADSLAFIRTIELLAQSHEREPLAQILKSRQTLARTADDSILWVSDADYLTDSPDLKTRVRALREQYPQEAITLLLSGKVSSEAEKTLRVAKILVIEDGIAEEPSPAGGGSKRK